MTMAAAVIALCLSFIWALYALPGAVAITGSAIEACKSLFVLCVEYASIAKIVVLWSAVGLISTGLIYASARAAANILLARRSVRALPVRKIGPVRLITDDALKTAFTCGLLRPRIYLSTGLMKGLDKKERRAVFIHELRHSKRRDPLRFLVYAFVKDAFFYLPAVGYAASFARLEKEREADDLASTALGGPVPVASALIKMARHHGGFGAAMAGEGKDTAARVARLIEGKDAARRVPVRAAFVSVAIGAALVATLSVPLYAGGTHECTIEKCELHVDKVAVCRAHCDSRHVHHH